MSFPRSDYYSFIDDSHSFSISDAVTHVYGVVQELTEEDFEYVLRMPEYGTDELDVAEPHLDIVKTWERVRAKSFEPSRVNEHRDAITDRIARLKFLTTRSGNAFNEASAELLERFCDDLKSSYLPSIFTVVNGNLRAIWEDESQQQIGIQFLPDNRLQYVIFRLYEGKLVETLGFELNIKGLRIIVEALCLNRLWFDGKR